jgi:hypothetical protein
MKMGRLTLSDLEKNISWFLLFLASLADNKFKHIFWNIFSKRKWLNYEKNIFNAPVNWNYLMNQDQKFQTSSLIHG